MTFVDRIGGMLIAPAPVLRHVAAGGRGGFRDALALLALGLLGLETLDLAREAATAARLDLASGLLGILRVAGQAAAPDLVVILAASVVLTIAAGRGRRDPPRDVALASCAWVPMFATRVAGALAAAAGATAAGQWIERAGLLWTAALVLVAIREVRR